MIKRRFIVEIMIVISVISLIFIGICLYIILCNSSDTKVEVDNEHHGNSSIIVGNNRNSNNKFIVDQNPSLYTYEDMENDINNIKNVFPNDAKVESLTDTIDGRKVYDIVLGDIASDKHIMIQGSIHAREYITTQLVMKQLIEFLRKLNTQEEFYNDRTARELISGCAIHIIPMVNPDGVSISQLGVDGIKKDTTLEGIKKIALSDGKSIDDKNYLIQWKANAQGVDLNRNFDALWDKYEGPSNPSSDHYKGSSVGCTAETKALIELTCKYPFKRTISYHTMGRVIYWYFGQTGNLQDETEKFAKVFSKMTGYAVDKNYENLDPAGYKDWAIIKMQIPSLTVEVGEGNNPVDSSQFEVIYQENEKAIGLMLNDINP